MNKSRFGIDLKHDTKQRKWKRLSVVTLSVEAIDAPAYHRQFCADNQYNPDQVGYRIVELDSSHIGGNNAEKFVRIVKTVLSHSATNACRSTEDVSQ